MKIKQTQNIIIKMIPLFVLAFLLLFSNGTKTYAASKSKLKSTKITEITRKSDSITVKWAKVKNATGYKIYIAKEDSKDKSVATIKNSVITTYKITGLKSDTKYNLKVRAFKKANKKLAYSPVKTVKTKQGLSKGYFCCERFNISWDTSKWKVESAYANCNSIILSTKGKSGNEGYLRIDDWYLDKFEHHPEKNLDEYASWYIDEDHKIGKSGFMYVRDAENKVVDGKTFAVLHATNPKLWYNKNNATLLCTVNGRLLVIKYYVHDNATSPKARLRQIEELLSKIEIKK